MKCPHCQTENLESSKFCKGCGRPLKSEIVCQKCQHANTLDSKFCVHCGQSLSPVTAPPATFTAPQVLPQPTSFANGRYQVKKFLGEGGKKKVYLAHQG